MKNIFLTFITLMFVSGIVHAEADKGICFLDETPPSDIEYTVIKKIKAGKGTYGSVNDVIPVLAVKAREIGANAIINYAGSQRFGFWPWRIVGPVVRGTAVKWDGEVDCVAIGGTYH